MPDEFSIDWDLVELLLCASDLARQGVECPLSQAATRLGHGWMDLAIAGRYEAQHVAGDVFDLVGDDAADAYLEAGYRVAEGRGASTDFKVMDEDLHPSFHRVATIHSHARKHILRHTPNGRPRTSNLDRQILFDRRVSDEFHRRLAAAGIEVEQ